jgi:hypothetical protein
MYLQRKVYKFYTLHHTLPDSNLVQQYSMQLTSNYIGVFWFGLTDGSTIGNTLPGNTSSCFLIPGCMMARSYSYSQPTFCTTHIHLSIILLLLYLRAHTYAESAYFSRHVPTNFVRQSLNLLEMKHDNVFKTP